MGILRTFPKSSSVTLALSLFLAGVGCLRQQEDPSALAKSGYQGCADATTSDGVTVNVNAIMPEQASEVQIFRNGTNVGSVFPDQSTTFTDNSIPSLGETYKYSCKAVVSGEGVMGYNQPTVQTIAPDAPTFSGIDTVTIVNKTQAKITWKAPSLSGTKATVFKIYANLETGAHADITATPIATINPPAVTYTLNTGLLGDNLNYAFAVTACTANGLCSGGNTYKTAQTQEDGAPKTTGFGTWKGISGGIELNIPWDHTKGEIRKRYIYINKSSNTVGGTNLADYDQLYVVDVQPSQLYNPTQWAGINKVQVVDSKVTENANHFFLLRDMDSSGQTTQLFQLNAYLGDLTPPTFPGLTSYNLKSGSEDTQVQVVFTAIKRQVEESDINGVSNYKIYSTSTPYVNAQTAKPNDPCLFGTAWPSLFPASSYAPGAGRIITLTGLTPRTYYRFCLKAVDAAGNESGNQDATMLPSLASWDKTPPQFDGIQSLSGVVIDGLYRIKASYNPATDLSSNVKYYKIHAWVDSPARDVVAQRNISDGWTTYAYLFNGVDLQYDDNVIVKVVVDACDDASSIPGMSADNCTSSALSSALVVIPPDITPPQDFLGLDSTWLSTNLPSSASPANGQVIVKFKKPTWFDLGTQIGADSDSVSKYSDYAGFNVYSVDSNNNISLLKACPCAVPGSCNKTTDLQCTINNLTPNSIYKLHARAYDSNGNVTTYLDPAFKSYSQIVKDTIAPTFVSALGVSWNPTIAKAVVTWTAAVDNQDASSNMYYEIYRKKTSDFTSGEKASPPSSNLRGTVTNVTTFQDMDQALDSAAEKLSGGGKFYYLACARDAQGNKTCDPVTKNLTLNDVVAPSITLVSSDKSNDTSGTYKKWYLQFHVDENESVMASLSLTVYAKYSSSAPATATTSDSFDTNGNNYLNWAYTPDDATNKKGTVRINNLVGSSNQKGYMNYLVVVRDEAGNSSSFTYSASFDNTMTAVSIANSSGTKLGGRLVVVKGTGFSSSTNNNAGVSTKVYFNSTLCTGVTVLSTGVLTCTTPAMSTGGLSVVTVQNPDGTSATISGGYTFTDGGSFPYTGCDASANAASTTQFASGDGSTGTPYLICNRDQLLLLGSDTYRASGFSFKISENLDLSSWAAFSPIGTNAKPFSGVVDGAGHLLSGLTYISTSTSTLNGVGLFGTVTSLFQFTNVILMNFNLTSSSAVQYGHIGTVVGLSIGTTSFHLSGITVVNSNLTLASSGLLSASSDNTLSSTGSLGGVFGTLGSGSASSGNILQDISVSGLVLNGKIEGSNGMYGLGGAFSGTGGVGGQLLNKPGNDTLTNIQVTDLQMTCGENCGGVLGRSYSTNYDTIIVTNLQIQLPGYVDMYGRNYFLTAIGGVSGSISACDNCAANASNYSANGGLSSAKNISVSGSIQITNPTGASLGYYDVNAWSAVALTTPDTFGVGGVFGVAQAQPGALFQNITSQVAVQSTSTGSAATKGLAAEVGGVVGTLRIHHPSSGTTSFTLDTIRVKSSEMQCDTACGGIVGQIAMIAQTNYSSYQDQFIFTKNLVDALFKADNTNLTLVGKSYITNVYGSAGPYSYGTHGGLIGSVFNIAENAYPGYQQQVSISISQSAARAEFRNSGSGMYSGGAIGGMVIVGASMPSYYSVQGNFLSVQDSFFDVSQNLSGIAGTHSSGIAGFMAVGASTSVGSVTNLQTNARYRVQRSFVRGLSKYGVVGGGTTLPATDISTLACDAALNSNNFIDQTTSTATSFYETGSSCAGYTMKTAAQMVDTSANIYQAAGWDFTTVWKWPSSGNNNGYPVLQWMGE